MFMQLTTGELKGTIVILTAVSIRNNSTQAKRDTVTCALSESQVALTVCLFSFKLYNKVKRRRYLFDKPKRLK